MQKVHVLTIIFRRDKSAQNLRPIKRRKRKEIKQKQNNRKLKNSTKKPTNPRKRLNSRRHYVFVRKRHSKSQNQISSRTSSRSNSAVSNRLLEIPRINRYRLPPSKTNQKQKDSPHWIQMSQRIKGHTPLMLGRRIPKIISSPRMRKLMKSQNNHERHD